MPFDTLTVTRDGPVAEIALSAPRAALGPTFWPELPAALAELEAAGARSLVLRPAGPNFSVGLDLTATAPVLARALQDRATFFPMVAQMQGAMEALANFPAPVVAAISGWCIGAGVELVACADLRVCSADARFSLPEVKLGIVPDLGGLARLPHLVGEGWARRLALTGEAIGAVQAERMGLVSEVLDTPEGALEAARALARNLAALPPETLRGIKRDLNARTEAQVRAHYRETGAWNALFMDPEKLLAALKK